MVSKRTMKIGDKRRAKKLQWFIQTVKAFYALYPEGKLSKEKLLSEFVFKTSSTERTGKEILRTLKNAEIIDIDGDLITLQEQDK